MWPSWGDNHLKESHGDVIYPVFRESSLSWYVPNYVFFLIFFGSGISFIRTAYGESRIEPQ